MNDLVWKKGAFHLHPFLPGLLLGALWHLVLCIYNVNDEG